MILLVGLGNPGAKYAGNRHNIGFLALDRIAECHNASPWKAKFQGLAAEATLDGARAVLLKPQTFMNESGRSIGEAMRFYKLTPADVVVMHDELDLFPGKVKVRTGGGAAGHNGIRSTDAHIGNAFRRVRIGIGHPGRKELVLHWVLGDFARADAEWLDPLLDGIAAASPWLAKGDDARFMTDVARFTAPPGENVKAARKPAAALPTAKAPDPPAPATGDTAARSRMAEGLKRLFGLGS